MAIEAFLFDVDGTLADTERDGHRLAFNKAFKELGLDWEWDVPLYGELLAVTGGKERIRFFIERFLPAGQQPRELDSLIPALHKAKTRHYAEMLAAGLIPMRPGVRRLIQEARAAGIRLAIVTTTTPENVTGLLRHSLSPDAESWFEVIAAGDIVPAKKPAPDIYLWALEKLGLSADQCVAFEDSRNGLGASLAAGVPTLVTVNDYTAGDDFTGATAVLSDLGEPATPFRQFSGKAAAQSYVDIGLVNDWFG